MTCSACRRERPDAASACPHCGATAAAPPPLPIVSATAGTAAAPAPARFGTVAGLHPPATSPASPPTSPQRRLLQHVAVVIYGLVLIGPLVALGISRSQGTLAFAMGEALGRSLIPAIIVVIYFTRKKPPASSVRVLFWLMTWMFVGQLTVIPSLAIKTEITTEDVPILMKEAAGIAPIRQPDTPARKAIRDVYRDLIESQRAYEVQVKSLQTPEAAELLQPSSFSSAESMQRMLEHVQKMNAVEKEQADSLKRFTTQMHAAIDGLNWSQNTKNEFKRGISSTTDRESQFRQRVLDSEMAWFASMAEVYQFSLEHQDKIGVVNVQTASEKQGTTSQITIQDEAVRTEFNQKMESAENLRQKFLEANAAFVQNLKANEKKLGLSRTELGLQPQ